MIKFDNTGTYRYICDGAAYTFYSTQAHETV